MISFFKNHKVHIVILLLIFGYGISIPGLWIMRTTPSTFQVSWIFTTLSLVLVLLFHKPLTKPFIYSLFAVGLVGFVVEAVGTNTGVVFGGYSYGPSLGPKVFGTPLAMLVNWMLPIYLVTMLLRPIVKNIWRLGFAGASVMVLYDILLEPVAIRLQMWSWEGGLPPVQNYIAWFMVSFPLVMLMGKHINESHNPLSVIVLVCQLLFFVALNILIAFFGF